MIITLGSQIRDAVRSKAVLASASPVSSVSIKAELRKHAQQERQRRACLASFQYELAFALVGR